MACPHAHAITLKGGNWQCGGEHLPISFERGKFLKFAKKKPIVVVCELVEFS